MSIITSFRAGLAFFTRIPVGSAPLPPTLSGVVAWLPAVGLLVGALAALALLLAARLGLPAALCGIGAALVWTVITGGLHLDGVADCGDGLLVETSPERRLTIMKDSRLGSFGALALFFVLSTKVTALAALAGTAPLHALGACCLAGLLGRCQVFVGMRLPSARPGGLGSMMHDGMKPRYAYTALGLCLAACLVMGRHGLYGLLAAGLVAFRLLSAARKRIGGVTGDVFGALIETTECAVLAVCGCKDAPEALSGREYETLDGGARLYAVPPSVMEAVMAEWQSVYPMQIYAPQEAQDDAERAYILILPE